MLLDWCEHSYKVDIGQDEEEVVLHDLLAWVEVVVQVLVTE